MTQSQVRQRIYPMLAWAVDLHDESGQVHQSLAGKGLIEPFGDQPALDAVVAVEQDGSQFDGNLLVIKRTLTAFFFKQWGGRTPKAGGRELDGRVWDEMPAVAVGPGGGR